MEIRISKVIVAFLCVLSIAAFAEPATKEVEGIERELVLDKIESIRGKGDYLSSSVRRTGNLYFVELTFVPHLSTKGICRTAIQQHRARISARRNVELVGPVDTWQAVAFQPERRVSCNSVRYDDLVTTGRVQIPDGYLEHLRSYIDSGAVRHNERELHTDDIREMEFREGFDDTDRIYLIVEFNLEDGLRLAVVIDEVSVAFQIRERRTF